MGHDEVKESEESSGMCESVPRRANFVLGKNSKKAWVLEEVSLDYGTWSPFIQFLKFDDPALGRAIRFGYYTMEGGKRTKIRGIFFETKVLEDFKKKIHDTRSYSIGSMLKELAV